MDFEEQEDIGKTSLYKDIDKEKYNLFLQLLSTESNEFIEVLNIMTDQNTVLKVLDTFAGQFVKFPSRKSVCWILEKVEMYTYLKKHNFSDEAYSIVSKNHNRTVYEIKKIVNVIEKNLGIR